MFLISPYKKFILLLACFGLIFIRSYTLFCLYFSLTLWPSFPCCTKSESGISQESLLMFYNSTHTFIKNKTILELRYVNEMWTTCIAVDYLTIQDKTKKGCCTFSQNLTTIVTKLAKLNEWKLYLFEQDVNCSIFISTQYINRYHHCCS